MAAIDLKNTVLQIRDGSSNHVDVNMGTGNITWDITMNREYLMDRGKLDTVRNGDEAPVDVKFDGRYDFITGTLAGASETSIEDALTKTGAASDWVSSAADPCEPYAVDLVFINNVPCETVDNEIVTFSDFRAEKISHDPKTGLISVTGKCNITMPTVSRGASSS